MFRYNVLVFLCYNEHICVVCMCCVALHILVFVLQRAQLFVCECLSMCCVALHIPVFVCYNYFFVLQRTQLCCAHVLCVQEVVEVLFDKLGAAWQETRGKIPSPPATEDTILKP